MLQVKNKKQISNNNVGGLEHIKTYYGCYEVAKIVSLHVHTLLWFNDSLDSNIVIQTLRDDDFF